MRIRCVGDSITFGQHLSFRRKAWPVLIGADGRGVCGETTRQALERFPRDVQHDPADVTVLQWGHNDANCWESDRGLPRVSLPAFKANLAEMIHRCRTFDTEPVLCTPTPTRKDPGYDDSLREYGDAVESVAYHWGARLIDVRWAFNRHGIDGLLMADGLHLTEAGHQVYADAVDSVLAKVAA